MSSSEEKKIRAELEGIYQNIDRIIKRIETEDPMKRDADAEASPDSPPPEADDEAPDTPPASGTP